MITSTSLISPRLPEDPNAIGRSAQRKACLRLIPLIAMGYALAYLDRGNISFASLRMNNDLHFSAAVYGLGAGIFFLGYAFCEVPSNLLLLRFGPRKWLARIMLTWGLLATAMMFVHSRWEFYSLRFLLGMAEAGFFPGVLYYMSRWFPQEARARTVSWFYIAPPLSGVVAGSLAGVLLGLNGRLGLSGWQWLFLIEGLPAVLFSIVFFFYLPDSPADAPWLTSAEKAWIQERIAGDGVRAQLGNEASLLRTLSSPNVWLIGGFFFCAQLASNAFSFSGPAILQSATGWNVSQIGFLMAGFCLLGIVSMLLNSAHSDRTGDRTLHTIIPCLVMGAAYIVASYARSTPIVVSLLAISFIAYNALQVPALALPTQFLAGRAAAVGLATMNTIGILGGFVGPYLMGLMKDATGSYQTGVRSLALPCLGAAGIMCVLMSNLKKGLIVPYTGHPNHNPSPKRADLALTPDYGAYLHGDLSLEQKLTIRTKLVALANLSSPSRILDIGCGRGLIAVGFATSSPAHQVQAIDTWNEDEIENNAAAWVASNARLEGANNVNTQTGDARCIPFEANTFDLVVSNLVVHNLPSADQVTAFAEMFRTLKPGGVLLYSDIDENLQIERAKKAIFTLGFKEINCHSIVTIRETPLVWVKALIAKKPR